MLYRSRIIRVKLYGETAPHKIQPHLRDKRPKYLQITCPGQRNTKGRERPRFELDELEEFRYSGEFDRSIDNPIDENSYG